MNRFLLFCSILAVGCQSLPRRAVVRQAANDAPTGRASKLLVLWTDSVLKQDDQPVAQGFVARVYLVGTDSQDPITAAGRFTFTAQTEPSGTSPVRQAGQEPEWRQWTFSAEQAAATLRQDPLGWGYSFWLPWGPPVATDQQCSLVVQFIPVDGQPVSGEPTLVQLPSLENSSVHRMSSRKEVSADEVRRVRR